ncbi:hypothetical protein [Paenibacillus sp. Z6-24]
MYQLFPPNEEKCPLCHQPVQVLHDQNEQHARFYICFDCQFIEEIGQGVVSPSSLADRGQEATLAIVAEPWNMPEYRPIGRSDHYYPQLFSEYEVNIIELGYQDICIVTGFTPADTDEFNFNLYLNGMTHRIPGPALFVKKREGSNSHESLLVREAEVVMELFKWDRENFYVEYLIRMLKGEIDINFIN